MGHLSRYYPMSSRGWLTKVMKKIQILTAFMYWLVEYANPLTCGGMIVFICAEWSDVETGIAPGHATALPAAAPATAHKNATNTCAKQTLLKKTSLDRLTHTCKLNFMNNSPP